MNQMEHTRLGRIVDYHVKMAEWYGEQKPAETSGNGRRRPTREGGEDHAPPKDPTAEQATAMAEMHTAIAKELSDLMAGDKPDAILGLAANPPVVRRQTPIMGHGVRSRFVPTRH
jgi:hypothetical protein